VGDTSPYDSDDQRDGLAALDFPVFSVAEDESAESDLDALDGYTEETAEQDKLEVPVFTVTNPPGTVTVTAFMDGRVKHVQLSPKVTDMTETDLADEIVVIAQLATQDARSAQYAYMLDGMRQQGHDDVTTRDFLARDLDLPSPDEVKAARAQLFSTRYAGGHD
jgi:DNA-binding protein YbaB